MAKRDRDCYICANRAGDTMTIMTPDTGPVEILSRGTVYIPFVATATTPTSRCLDDTNALAFYNLLSLDSRQQHPELTCCPSLVKAARMRARGLATVDPWAHVDANGVTSNQYARLGGCILPEYYAKIGNNIESLVAGSADANVCLEALAGSPKHAAHIFGLSDFFREQTRIGIAMAEGGVYGWYWVIMIAVCETSNTGE